jgi:hypothetical protein
MTVDGLPNNEARADLGVRAVRSVVRRTDSGELMACTSIEDALSYIAQACDRFGLAPAETFRDGLRRYAMQIENGPSVVRIACGESTTLEKGNAADRERGRRASRRRPVARS